MESLDRLVWAEGQAVRAYGVRLGIRASEAGVLEPLLARLPPSWRPASSGVVDRLYSYVAGGRSSASSVRRLHLLYVDGARVARDRSVDPVLDALELDARHTVAALAPGRVFVHAGAVGFRGRAILIPGRSFTGKTTLVAELVRQGATYYSDEYAVLDERGLVHPFARPLSMREDGNLPVTELGGRAGRAALPVGAIVIAPYRDGARWRPRLRSGGEGALALLAQAVPVRGDPRRTMATVRAAAARAAVLQGARGEARETAHDLLARADALPARG